MIKPNLFCFMSGNKIAIACQSMPDSYLVDEYAEVVDVLINYVNGDVKIMKPVDYWIKQNIINASFLIRYLNAMHYELENIRKSPLRISDVQLHMKGRIDMHFGSQKGRIDWHFGSQTRADMPDMPNPDMIEQKYMSKSVGDAFHKKFMEQVKVDVKNDPEALTYTTRAVYEPVAEAIADHKKPYEWNHSHFQSLYKDFQTKLWNESGDILSSTGLINS